MDGWMRGVTNAMVHWLLLVAKLICTMQYLKHEPCVFVSNQKPVA